LQCWVMAKMRAFSRVSLMQGLWGGKWLGKWAASKRPGLQEHPCGVEWGGVSSKGGRKI